MTRKRTNGELNLTFDGTLHGLARIFERIADHWEQVADQRVAGLREAASLTRKLTSGRDVAGS